MKTTLNYTVKELDIYNEKFCFNSECERSEDSLQHYMDVAKEADSLIREGNKEILEGYKIYIGDIYSTEGGEDE